MKIALYYDSLWVKGGAERVVCQLAEQLQADIITSGLNPMIKEWLNPSVKIVDIGNALIRKNVELGMLVEAPLRFSRYTPPDEYDIHLFVGFNSIFAAREENKNIWFCLTPNRMLYDHRKLKLNSGSISKRLFFWLYQLLLIPFDQRAVQKIQTIVAQTNGIKERIHRYYHRHSDIIYSPINTADFHFESYEDYFLTVGRLTPEKRTAFIAEVFTDLPEKKLVIVGKGSEEELIRKIIANSPNITLYTDLPDEELKKLYANCLATIYMPKDEDFGLIPLEGMASGKICIAAREGGCLETILDKKTGILVEPRKHAVTDVINTLEIAWATSQKSTCQEQARQFDIHNCIQKWTKLLGQQ